MQILILFKQDDPPVGVYILHQGHASLSMKSQEGRSILSVQALPGSLIGLPGVIGNQPYSLTAAARAGAQVSFVSSADFFALMRVEPAVVAQDAASSGRRGPLRPPRAVLESAGCAALIRTPHLLHSQSSCPLPA